VLGHQVLAVETDGDGKAFCSLANQHHVTGLLHDGFRHPRNILDIPHCAYRACTTCRSVHAAGIELNKTIFIQMCAETDALIVRIIFGAGNDSHRGLERIATTLEEKKCLVNVIKTVMSREYDRALRLAKNIRMPRSFGGSLTFKSGGE
jgi:hypothetical protein